MSTEAYKLLIEKHFIQSNVKQIENQQPQRFSDLKREKSFGKIIEDIHSRKSSCEKENNPRKNNSLF